MINIEALSEGYTVLERKKLIMIEAVKPLDLSPNNINLMRLAATVSIPITYSLLSTATASAAGVGSFDKMHGAVLSVFDAGVVLVISFAGAAWALGHRSKAIEIFIGCCCGYLLVRHAIEIRDFLKSI